MKPGVPHQKILGFRILLQNPGFGYRGNPGRAHHSMLCRVFQCDNYLSLTTIPFIQCFQLAYVRIQETPMLQDEDIVLFLDIAHLEKNTRNSLLAVKKFKFPPIHTATNEKMISMGEGRLGWSDLYKVHEVGERMIS